MKCRSAAVFVLVLGSPAATAAQVVSGRVTDAETEAPVAQAELVFVSDEGTDTTRVVADDFGLYTATLPQPGRYIASVSRLGYGAAEVPAFDVAPGERLTLNLKLAPSGVALDPIVVEGESGFEPGRIGFDRRCALGKGICLNADSIALRKPAISTDIFRGVKGLHVLEVSQAICGRPAECEPQIKTDSGECIMVFVNNSLLPAQYTSRRRLPRVGVISGPDPVPLFQHGLGLNIIMPEDVKGVEIYRDYREIPLELRTSMLGHVLWPTDNFSCGAALVWTEAAW